jgi:hypothetical protein
VTSRLGTGKLLTLFYSVLSLNHRCQDDVVRAVPVACDPVPGEESRQAQCVPTRRNFGSIIQNKQKVKVRLIFAIFLQKVGLTFGKQLPRFKKNFAVSKIFYILAENSCREMATLT